MIRQACIRWCYLARALPVLLWGLAGALPSVRPPPLDVYKGPAASALYQGPNKLQAKCELHWRNTTLDHFDWKPAVGGRTTFPQRFFVCKEFWKAGGPIFFYAGNEADVTLYLENTGLMWENAEDFGALLVFAEHRYYGKSKPYREHPLQHLEYLTSEQALADYAELISELKADLHAEDAAVISFGGSYGGMLTTWFRLKYPHIIDGGIAGSAPIWTYYGEDPPMDPLFFNRLVTRDATPAAGSAAACADNVRKAWRTMFSKAGTAEGRRTIKQGMRLCDDSHLDSEQDVDVLANFGTEAFGSMAMGDYPYPSSYILNGVADMPAFPMRVACSHLADPELEGTDLLDSFAQAIGVFHNATGDVACYDYNAAPNPQSQEVGFLWGLQYCTENFMPFATDGVHDMFWSAPWDLEAAEQGCRVTYGVTPRPFWMTEQYGGRDMPTLSNMVFSNGGYDPWSGGGVLRNLSDSVIAVFIPEGAHHLDLMFSHPDDPASVKAARQVEAAEMRSWVKEKALSVQRHAAASAERVQQTMAAQ